MVGRVGGVREARDVIQLGGMAYLLQALRIVRVKSSWDLRGRGQMGMQEGAWSEIMRAMWRLCWESLWEM